MFSGNNIGSVGAIALSVALQHNSTLLNLNLSNSYYTSEYLDNDIKTEGFAALAAALQYNSSLLSLGLSCFYFLFYYLLSWSY